MKKKSSTNKTVYYYIPKGEIDFPSCLSRDTAEDDTYEYWRKIGKILRKQCEREQ